MSPTSSATPDPASPAVAAATATATALLQLGLIPGLHGAPLGELLAAFESPEELAAQPWRRLADVLGNGAVAERLRAGPDLLDGALAQARSWAAHPGNHLLTCIDAAYPATLRQLGDRPLVLWLKGNPELLNDPAIAIVGSRRPTPQGLQDARAFALHLGRSGLTVVSGLAEGIDGAAHQGALDTTGRTLAVLAHGLDRIYPPAHRALAHAIAGRGLLMSEYPLGTAALRHHFPERNRLISALSLGVLVIEAALGSGSLITARSGMDQGREVMALPGSIHSPLSKGCHRLIRDGATLVESVQDVWQQLAPQLTRFRELPGPSAAEIDQIVDPEADPVLFALLSGPAGIDAIAAAIGLTAAEVSSILGRRELEGRIVRLPDGRYQRLVPGQGVPSAQTRDS